MENLIICPRYIVVVSKKSLLSLSVGCHLKNYVHPSPGEPTYIKSYVNMSENRLWNCTHITEVINHKNTPFSEPPLHPFYMASARHTTESVKNAPFSAFLFSLMFTHMIYVSPPGMGMWNDCPHPYSTLLHTTFLGMTLHNISDPESSRWARFTTELKY